MPSKHCYADEHGRVQVNMTSGEFMGNTTKKLMYGGKVVTVRRSKHCSDGSVSIHSRTDQHFIMSIPAAEEESREILPAHLLAYARQSSPPYGSILSRRFLMHYHANDVAKEYANFVNFDVRGIFTGQLDPAESKVSNSVDPNELAQREQGWSEKHTDEETQEEGRLGYGNRRASRAGILVLLASTSTEAKFPGSWGLVIPVIWLPRVRARKV